MNPSSLGHGRPHGEAQGRADLISREVGGSWMVDSEGATFNSMQRQLGDTSTSEEFTGWAQGTSAPLQPEGVCQPSEKEGGCHIPV